jgi:PAS domain S-box-containing protein
MTEDRGSEVEAATGALARLLADGSLLDSMATGLLLQDAAGDVIDANETARQLLGMTTEEITGRNSLDPEWRAVHDDGKPFAGEDHPAFVTLRTGEPCSRVVMGVDNPGFARRWMAISTAPVTLDDGAPGVVTSFVDISDRVNRSRMLALLTEVNRFVAVAEGESGLLQHLCTTLVELGGYSLAWVGHEAGPDDSSPRRFVVTEAAGAVDFVWGEDRDEVATALARSPASERLRRGHPVVANTLVEATGLTALYDRARDFGFRSGIAIPMRTADPSVLCVYSDNGSAFDPITAGGLIELANTIEFGAVHLRSVAMLAEALDGTVASLSRMTEARDPYTAGHQQRVGRLGEAIATAMGLDAATAKLIRLAGEVHDIGKSAVPAEILTRPGRLSDIEQLLVREHPGVGYDILAKARVPWPIAEVARDHHERLDGSGYPSGLRGDAVSLPARIIAVGDVVEAMTHHRPYRPGLGLQAAMDEVRSGAGTRYDPDVVAACEKVIAAGFTLD